MSRLPGTRAGARWPRLLALACTVCALSPGCDRGFEVVGRPADHTAQATDSRDRGCDPSVAVLNQVDPGLLEPVPIAGMEEQQAYLEAFPFGDYEIHEVPGVGAFFLDSPTDVIKDVLRQGRVWEPHIVKLLEAHIVPGSTAIDVGAHIGTHTVTMSRLVGRCGHVYAFEPQARIHRELVKNLELNHVCNATALRCAVGATPGVVELTPPPVGNVGATAIGTGGEKVELRTLDSFGFRNVSLLKIDVECFEDEVLNGARETIVDNRPTIIVEIMTGYRMVVAPPATKERIQHTISYIEGLGYSVSNIRHFDYLAIPVQTPRDSAVPISTSSTSPSS